MTLELLDQTLPFVKNHIYPQRIPLPDWKMREGDIPGASETNFNDKAWRTIQVPFPWGGYDKMAWFRRSVVVPPEFSGKPIALLIDLPESLLYLNGNPHFGIDAQHQEVPLSAKARGNQHYLVAIQSYSGRSIVPTSFQNAELAVVYPPARSLFYALKTLRELAQIYGTATAEGKEIREIIRRTLIFLKYFKPEGEEYPNAIGRALNFLIGALGTEFGSNIPGLVHLVGSALVAPAGSWTPAESGRKTAEVFSTVFQLMEEYPELVFGLHRAHLYEQIEQQHTELFKKLRQRIEEGRWELLGGMWSEPDCNLASGESLVRQVLYGKRYFKARFNKEPEIAWLPGTYGFSGNLPQLLTKSGYKYLVAAELLHNDTNKFPFHTFWWQGIEKTRILAYVPPISFDQVQGSKELKKSWDVYQQKDTAPDYLLTLGYGAGKLGPSMEQLELLRLFKNTPGLPKTRSSSVWEFFKQAETQTQDVPVWADELYLEKYRGIYTTNAQVKQNNRVSESLLATAEVLSSLAMLAGVPPAKRKYPQEELHKCWKQHLTLQDRTVLSGTAIADAYEDVAATYRSIIDSTTQIIKRSADLLTESTRKRENQFHFAVFNPLSWERSEYVLLSFKSNEKLFTVMDDRGLEVEHQIVEQSKGKVTLLCYLPTLLPQSFRNLTVYPGIAKALNNNHWKISRHVIESPYYRIRLDNKGGISSLYDKQQRRELIKKGKRGNLLQTFADRPKQWEAWDLDIESQTRQLHVLKLKSYKVVEEGPLRVVVRFEYRTSGPTKLLQDMILYHKHRRIDFQTSVRWFEKQTLLKATFPLDVKSHQPTYEIPFGAISRTSRYTSAEHRAKFEVPALQWADLSDSRGGASLLNNAKYGYDANESTLRLTLLRSPHYAHPIDPAKLTDNRVSDQGDHHFAYALLPHVGDWKKALTVRAAREFNVPPLVFADRSAYALPPLVSSSHPNVMIETIKKAEDSQELVIRLYEAHGEQREATLEFGFPIQKVFECDLLENTLNNLKSSKTKVKLKFKPFEIKTLKVTLKPLTVRKKD